MDLQLHLKKKTKKENKKKHNSWYCIDIEYAVVPSELGIMSQLPDSGILTT
jgi:hypothetical protein